MVGKFFIYCETTKLQKIKTACSRHRYKLESEGKVSTLHCTRNGNYESLQCDSGICWCADEKTGGIVDGTRAVPQNMWTHLPCCKCHFLQVLGSLSLLILKEEIYLSDNATEFGTEYLRQCESMAYAQNILQENLAMHGTLYVSIVKTQCDYDGSYGTYSIDNNM